MEVLRIIAFTALTTTVTCICLNTSWEKSFDYTGLATCKERNVFIRGFERSEIPFSFWQSDGLHLIEGVECCSSSPQWLDSELHTVHANWGDVLRKRNVWAKCPDGHFLQGLYRSDSGWPLYRGYLYHLKDGRCSRPVGHPDTYAWCYTEDISDCFDQSGLCSCTRNGYLVTGIYIGGCVDLHCLDKLYCCRMAEHKVELDSPDSIKGNIMDKTLKPMAHLAHMLGFGWPGGCRAPFVGEDFYKYNDTWVAAKNGRCRGMKINHRLNIIFRDWRFESKIVKFGEEIIEEFDPQIMYHGLIFYNGSSPSSKTLRWRVYVKDVIAHTMSDKWLNEDKIRVKINFNISNTSGFTCVKKTDYQNSNLDCSSLKFIELTSSKVLQPRSYYIWKVKMNKVRTTLPYTAVVLAKFSTEFKSFLRKGETTNSTTTSFHKDFRSSKRRQIYSYRFGNSSVPFYRALREQSNASASPWLWRNMKRSYSYAQSTIDRLTDESVYSFLLRGTLQRITSAAFVQLEDSSSSEREAHDFSQGETGETGADSLPDIDIYHVMANPNDITPNVTHPEVELNTESNNAMFPQDVLNNVD